jgi:putative variant cofactor biosynthesis B12-binding/radical SAM domain protein 1
MMKRKILLVQLPTSHFGAQEKVYPLGLSRLSSTIPQEFDKRVIDMNVAADAWAELKQLLDAYQPDVAALSFRNLDPLAGHQASYLSSLKTAALMIEKLVPKARILAGGPAFSLFAERLMLEVPQLDIGLKGEGELVFSRLLEVAPDVKNLPGIVWRNGEQVVVNPAGLKIELDNLPELDLQAFSPSDYVKGNSYVAAMGIEGKRGCDLHCGYCLYPFLGGTSMRLRKPEKIVDEMEILYKEHRINLFHFTDPVVNRPTHHFQALCQELLKRKLKVSWTGFFREDLVSRENLALARDVGLCGVYFSGDALTDRGLKLLNKRMSQKDLLHGARVTADLGLLTMCHFLLNLPGETQTEIQESQDMLDKILEIHHPKGNLGAVIFNHVRLYPEAPLTRKIIAGGELDPQTDLLYPVYYNPEKYNHVLHDFEARCHAANVLSRLEISL